MPLSGPRGGRIRPLSKPQPASPAPKYKGGPRLLPCGGWTGTGTPPRPPPPPLSAGACTARQCLVASEMACQPWGIPRGRGVQTQARAAMACPPLSFLPTSRSAAPRNVPYFQARRPAIRRCSCPSPSTLHVSRRSGGATVPPPPPVHVSRRSDGAAPHPTPSPLVPAPYSWTGASRHAQHA